jgi:lysophosphatidic acid acyltransferase / lysophosphatidylinositol acyltransferase
MPAAAGSAEQRPPRLTAGGVAGGLCVFVACVAAGAVACAVQAASLLLVRPFSLRAHRRASVALNSAFFLCSVWLLERWNRMRIVVYGEAVPPGLPAVCTMNHISDVDMLVGVTLLARYGAPFPGNAKAIVKSALASVPVFGWLLWFGEFLFVTRSWEADKARLLADLRSLLTYPVPVWFVLWPEGSRATPGKIATAQAYAARNRYPHLTHVLLPRFKAFLSVMSVVRPGVDDLCDVTLMFEGPVPRAPAVLSGACETVVHAHLARHKVSDMPEGDAELEAWLIARWQEKDARIDAFKREGAASLGAPCADGVLGSGRPAPSVAPFAALVASGIGAAAATLWLSYDNAFVFRILVAGPPLALLFAAVFLALAVRPSSKGLSADQKNDRKRSLLRRKAE